MSLLIGEVHYVKAVQRLMSRFATNLTRSSAIMIRVIRFTTEGVVGKMITSYALLISLVVVPLVSS